MEMGFIGNRGQIRAKFYNYLRKNDMDFACNQKLVFHPYKRSRAHNQLVLIYNEDNSIKVGVAVGNRSLIWHRLVESTFRIVEGTGFWEGVTKGSMEYTWNAIESMWSI